MNQGQEKFFQFIMDNVKPDCQKAAEELLSESFLMQNEGKFNQEYLSEFIPKMLELVKPEGMEQVKGIMMNYKEK